MEWITPKTDWVDEDWVTHVDYNRIRNNLLYINELLNEKYPESAIIISLGGTKSYGDNYYPSEFNAFESCLDSFKRIGVDLSIGTRSYYYGNKKFINAAQLNRLETCCLRWKEINPPVSSIEIEPASFKISIGETQQLILTVEPDDADYTVTWTSSDTSVMTVDSDGLVTAISSGTAVITATVHQTGYEDKSATSNGKVRVPFTSIQWQPQNLTMERGEVTTCYLIVQPTDADIEEILFGGADEMGWVSNIKETETEGKYSVTITAVEDAIDDVIKEGSSGIQGIDIEDFVISIPAESSKDDLIAYLTITVKASGAYYPLNNVDTYISWKVIAHNAEKTSKVTTLQLIAEHEYLNGGYYNVKESGAQWRTQVQKFIDEYFTDDFNSSCKTVSKKCIGSYSGTLPNIVNYSSRYHLPSCDEFCNSFTFNCPVLASNYYYPVSSAPTLSRTISYNGQDKRNHITIITGNSCSESVAISKNSGSDSPTYSLSPLFFLPVDTKVKYYTPQGLSNPQYYFDWSGESELTLKDLPPNTYVYDIGKR